MREDQYNWTEIWTWHRRLPCGLTAWCSFSSYWGSQPQCLFLSSGPSCFFSIALLQVPEVKVPLTFFPIQTLLTYIYPSAHCKPAFVHLQVDL